jgi:hypothetical protein
VSGGRVIAWRGIHASSWIAFWGATFRLLTAGTDAGNPASRGATVVVTVTVVFLTLVRCLGGRGGGRRPRPVSARRAEAVSQA